MYFCMPKCPKMKLMPTKLHCSLAVLYFLCISVYANLSIDKDSIPVATTSNSNYIITPDRLTALDALDESFPVVHSDQKSFTAPEFTYDRIRAEYAVGDKILEDRQKAAAMFDDIETQGTWVDSFSNEDIQTLPVGMKYIQDQEGTDVELGLMSAVVNKDYIEFTAFIKVTLAQTDDTGKRIELFFGANNIKMSHQGGIIGDANLVLMGDVVIPYDNGSWLLMFKGGFDYETGITENITYANMDCDGLKEISIQGEIQFSRDRILPANADGTLQKETREYTGANGQKTQIPNRVTGSFSVVASDPNDVLVEVSISPFVLTKSPDKFLFSANTALLDLSDLRTEGVVFPQFYHDNGLLYPSQESWRGVYVESLVVGLPDVFKTKKTIANRGKVTFDAHHLIIDNNGVSGFFGVNNLVPLEEGRTNERKAWAMSIDRIEVEIAASRLVSGGLSGRVMLPIAKSDNIYTKSYDTISQGGETTIQSTKESIVGLGYSGMISEDEYAMRMTSLDTVYFDYWSAQAQLYPNSYIELKVADKSFRPKAVLNLSLIHI